MLIRYRLRLLALILLSNFMVRGQPVVDFNVISPLTNCNPAIFNFQNVSTGNGLTYEWNFGVYPGVNSVFENPSTTYLNCGAFQVKLTVTDTNGLKDSAVQTVNVHCSPTADFTTPSAIGCQPYSAGFNSISQAGSGTITSYVWDFGDGSSGSGVHPTHTYQEAGCKNVTLIVTNSYNCVSDTTINNILCIYSPPTANFTSNTPSSCSVPYVIDYNAITDSSAGPYSYYWIFQGGTPAISAVSHPTVTYYNLGTFSTTLIITDPHGCSDTIVKSDYVQLTKDTSGFTIHSNTYCAAVNITVNGYSTGNPNSWNWSVSPAATIAHFNAKNTTITFPTAGSYDVCLTTSYDGGCTYQNCSTVVIHGSPIAKFGVDGLLNTCITPNNIYFSDSSSGSNLSYNWSFPGGSPATAINAVPPQVSYSNCGRYSASLTVTDSNGCRSTASKSNFLQINCNQTSYTVTPGNGCLPLTASFTGTSTDSTVSWLWDFDDPNSGVDNVSTLQNPAHTFYTAGCFTVKLTTTNAEGCTSSYSLPAAVCAGWKPHANFSGLPPYNCASEPIYFADSSTGTFEYTEYVWGFHDSTHWLGSSILQNPNHTFWDVGTYDITLIVSNYGCADTLTKDDYVQVFVPVSVPKVVRNCGDGLSVTLDGTESVGAQHYSWIILGGTPASASTSTVVATFPGPGDYNASLYVENDSTGCNDLQNVVVHISGIEADFSASPVSGCSPLQTCFSNTSTYGSSFEWHVFDSNGNEDTSANRSSPCFIFENPGSYSVQLIVTDDLGCMDTLYKPDYIHVSDLQVNFSADRTKGCAPLEVSFSDSSIIQGSDIAEWRWNFADALSGSANTASAPNSIHVFNHAGNYPVKLTVADSNGCSQNLTKTIQVNKPDANFATGTTPNCNGTQTCFTISHIDASASYLWDFGDENISDSANICHIYTDTGQFNIVLITTDTLGCSDTTTQTESNHFLIPHARFVADTTTTTCPPLAVTFSNLSTGTDSVTSWYWDFGDGQVSSKKNPFHIYAFAEKFTVSLIATNFNGCTDTLVYPEYINISGPTAYIATPPLSGCVPDSICMSAVSASASIYTWNLGDGMVKSGSDSICYVYTRPGSYYPELILSDESNCIFSLPMGRVDVKGIVADFVADTAQICREGTVSFTDSSYGASPVAMREWNFGDPASGVQNVSSLQNPSHFFAAPGNYQVTETIISIEGCKDSAERMISIFSAPVAFFDVSENALCGPSAQFSTTNNSSGAESFWWDFGNNTFSETAEPQAIYNSAGSFSILLTAVNEHGCTDTLSQRVTVFPAPEIQEIEIDPAEGCQPLRVSFYVNSNHVQNYTWDFGGDSNLLSSSSPSANFVYADTGTFNVSLFVSSENDCLDTLILPAAVIVHGPPVADFDFTANSSGYPYNGTVDFINKSQNAESYFWEFGDGTVSTEISPSHEYESIDWFSALLTATTEFGCQDTATKKFYVIKKALYIPNALQPDYAGSEGLIKVWKPIGIGLQTYHAQVFDQWGKLLWESTELTDTEPVEAWDGTYLGKACPQDVYVWKIDATFVDGTVWEGMSYTPSAGGGRKNIGSITLIR